MIFSGKTKNHRLCLPFAKVSCKYRVKRPICSVCQQRFRAINYYRDGIAHYRTRCEYCIKKSRQLKPPKPRWQLRGFKKRNTCDLCGFRSRYTSQIVVYHIDGDLNNSELTNLRCACRNCVEVLIRSDTSWRRGDLEPDF
jgi:hypothetical protein